MILVMVIMMLCYDYDDYNSDDYYDNDDLNED